MSTLHDDDSRLTYFAYLSRRGRLSPVVKAIVDRYNITMYLDAVCGLDFVQQDDRDSEKSSTTSRQINFSFKNSDDDVERAPSQLPVVVEPPSQLRVDVVEPPVDVSRLTYFAYLSRTGRLSPAIKPLDRYHITTYFDACDVSGLESEEPDVSDSEKSSKTSEQVNFSTVDDDVESPASRLPADTGGTHTSHKFGMKARWPCVRWPSVRWPSVRWPSVKWPSVRWPSDSQLGDSRSTSMTSLSEFRTGVDASWPSDSQLSDSSSSMISVCEFQRQTPHINDQKLKDLDDRKDIYEEGNSYGRKINIQRYHSTNVNYRQSCC